MTDAPSRADECVTGLVPVVAKKYDLVIAAVFFISIVILTIPAGAAPAYGFISQWGSIGNGPEQFHYPGGITIASSGDIYIADTYNHRIQKFSSSGGFLDQWGTFGTGDMQFGYPSGVAVDSAENVYVADTYNSRVKKYDSSGGYITKWGSGMGPEMLNSPMGIAVDSNGNVYVVDFARQLVQKYDSSGGYITQWGEAGSGPGQFSKPIGVAVDSNGDVYVTDPGNNRVQEFDSTGGYITQWGETGSGPGQFSYPRGIAVDSTGNVYVTDQNNNRVQEFDSTGGYITQWGETGSGPGQFNTPVGIAVASAGDVFVVDQSNNRIERFATRPAVSSVYPRGGPQDTPVAITGYGFLTATAVMFGSVPATSFIVDSGGSITAVAPAGSGTADIRITSPGGTSEAIAADEYYLFPPSAVSGFTGSPTSGIAPLTVSFTDSSSNNPISWDWNFGSWNATDNGISKSRNPAHTYDSPGTYTISLSARNANGGDTFSRTGYIIVTGSVPLKTNPPGATDGATSSGPSALTSSDNDGSDSGTGPTPVRQGPVTLSVDSAYLAQHGVTPADIRIMNYNAGNWSQLETRFTGSSGNRFYFSADSDRYSILAIGNTKDGITGLPALPGTTTPAPTVHREAVASYPQTGTEGRIITRDETAVPVIPQPSAVPQVPTLASAGTSGFPFMTAALIGAGCVVLFGGSWYIRRWWIRRQNPALFREND